MIKNHLVVVSSFIFMLMLVPGVLGESVELHVSTGQQPSNMILSCPDSVLSDIDVMVTNLGGVTDTIELKLDWPADLGFIQPYRTLASGESATITPFWITLPYNLDPGVYHAKVTAKSLMTGDAVTKDIEIEVLRCYSVRLDVEDDYERSCRETEEPVTYEIEVINEGKWPETFEMSASVDWAEFSEEEVSLESGTSATVSLVLSPPGGLPEGIHTVIVTARSIGSYAVGTVPVEVDIAKCFKFSTALEPESQTTCMGEGRDFELIIENPGDIEDEFTIETPDWVYSDRDSLIIGPLESDSVMLTAIYDEAGVYTFEVTVSSVRDDSAQPQTVSGILDVEECRGAAIAISPPNVHACRGDDVEYSVNVKNVGSISSTFELSSTFGELESAEVTLDADQSETVLLRVDTADLPEGTVIIDVTASDGPVTGTASTELELEDCFTAGLTVQPDDAVVCPGATVPYTIKVRNTGMKPDEYTLEFADETIEMTLQPDESQTISYDFDIPGIEEGVYKFTVTLTSESGVSIKETSEMTMKSSEACYGVELEDDPGYVDVAKADTVEITIRNLGEQADTFMVSLKEGPGWVYIEPTEVHIGGGEEEKLYLYMSPGFGTKEGEYTAIVRAESDNAEDELIIPITVPEDVTEEPAQETPENVSINVTQNVTDGSPITGSALEARPFWKTAAVASIALIIVAILVLRFVFLLKK
jgi:uncharacterized membrane protein